ncbi:exodeoxyribonuclease VII large subunit [Arthrobacter sp. SAFR-179]|uniref:exodeoxyribonuclease VII large subunit n=1 Tax=Arthrobacter sp. SAFR-179 TaxID=3387279 RepID=UPI003F7C7F2D
METNTPAGRQKVRAFGRDLIGLEEVLSGVGNSLGTSPISIFGECREPRRTGTEWRFELADIQSARIQVLPARVDARNAPVISRYLRSKGTSIAQALQTGNSLELEATVTLDRRKKLILDVTKISPRFSPAGRIYARDQKTIQQLAHAGVPANRLDGDRIHAPIASARRLLPDSLERVLVIGSDKSQGLADFKESVRRAQQSGDLDVEYQSVTWSADSAARHLASILNNCEAGSFDLAVLVRGGGHWSDLDVFNDPAVALAVRNCPVPIATAVGHATDVLMADRAAEFSFTTPTAAGEAIRREVARRSMARGGGPAADLQGTAALLDAKRRRYEAWLAERNAALEVSRLKVGYFENQLLECAASHTGDLIFLAKRRVRLLSLMWFPAVLGALLVYLLAIPALLENLGTGATGLTRGTVAFAGVLAAAVSLRTIHRRRKAMDLPAEKAMKNPPGTFNEWRHMARNVLTVRGLRRAIRHRPW